MSESPEEQTSLSELFGADPLSLTRETRKPIIEYYRSRRTVFLSGGKVPRAVKAKEPKGGPLPDIDLDLGDLT